MRAKNILNVCLLIELLVVMYVYYSLKDNHITHENEEEPAIIQRLEKQDIPEEMESQHGTAAGDVSAYLHDG